MRKFNIGDRVVYIHENELIAGTIKNDYIGLDMYIVESDTAVAKISGNLLAPEPERVLEETRDNKETLLLGCLAIVDKITTAVTGVDLALTNEPDYE